MEDADVVLVGGGGAGLTLLHQLSLHGPSGLRVVVVDPVDRLALRPHDRTWCFWERAAEGASDVEAALSATWDAVVVRSPDVELDLRLAPLRYAMLRSGDYAALVADVVASSGLDVEWVAASVTGVRDGPARATVSWAGHPSGSGSVRARWVFDSRPAEPLRPARTTLLQHFRGVFVHDPDAPFDPDRAVLMDFGTPQPARGLSFGYCLPLSTTRALVEYTEFSPAVLDDAGYTTALDRYLAGVVGPRHVVEHVEQGVIPMTDAEHGRRAGRRVFRVGTAGGATRASTGYTFTGMRRQARAVADALTDGRVPEPPPAYPARHRLADAALLRALDSGAVDGPAFFTRLFARNPVERVLRFLDGDTSAAADLAVIASAPALAMARSAAWVAAHPQHAPGRMSR